VTIVPTVVYSLSPTDGNSSNTLPVTNTKLSYPKPLNDPAKAVDDSTPYLNIAKSSYLASRTRASLQNISGISPLTSSHRSYGSYINYNTAISGVYAAHEVRTDLTFPADSNLNVLYAPTLNAPNWCPVESATMYDHEPGAATTTRSYIVSDNNLATHPVVKPIDSTFMSKYVRTYPEGQLYFTEIFNNGQNWYVFLYNFNTAQWEQQYVCPVSEMGTDQHGWEVWESYLQNTNPTVPKIEMNQLQVGINNNWYYVDSSRGALCDSLTGYNKQMVSQYYHWKVWS
jgi:hypothetical protein